jgi:hypothetical protein
MADANIDGGFNLVAFRQKVHSIGRSQYFAVEIPTVSSDTGYLTAIARSTSLPGRTQEPIDVWYRGMPMKVDGKATFDAWTVTFLLDEAQTVRNAILAWQDGAYNVDQLKNAPHNSYKSDTVKVYQLDLQRQASVQVNFAGMWPTAVGEVELNQEGGIETCQVTFTYDFWTFDPISAKGTGSISKVIDAIGKIKGVASGVANVAGALGSLTSILKK